MLLIRTAAENRFDDLREYKRTECYSGGGNYDVVNHEILRVISCTGDLGQGSLLGSSDLTFHFAAALAYLGEVGDRGDGGHGSGIWMVSKKDIDHLTHRRVYDQVAAQQVNDDHYDQHSEGHHAKTEGHPLVSLTGEDKRKGD